MSPMTMIESHGNAGVPILTNDNDEEFGEEIVALFIAHVNSLRHAQGLSDLCVGALSSPGLSTLQLQHLRSGFNETGTTPEESTVLLTYPTPVEDQA
jgi:hypothetical protein